MDGYYKNVPSWAPTDTDYRLIFKEIDGIWTEISHNLPQYADMTLAQYLEKMGLDIPYGTSFLRLDNDYIAFEYRDYHSYVRIDVSPSNRA